MKKASIIIMTAAVTLLFSSCRKDEIRQDTGNTEFILSVALPQGQTTKTQLSEKGASQENVYDILWNADDRISVNGIVSNTPAVSGKKQAGFTFPTAPEAPYFILYPANEGSVDTVILPATQTYTAGSFDSAAAPMYGSGADADVIQMHNLTGTICLPFKGEATLTRMEITANGGEPIYGTVTLEKNVDSFTGNFGITDGGNSVTLSFGGGLKLGVNDIPVYIPVPAQTYASGFTVKVYSGDNDYMQLKFWGSGNTVSGTKLYEFPATTFAAGRIETIVGIDPVNVSDAVFDTHITVGSYNTWAVSMRNKYYNNRSNPSSQYYSGEGDGYMVENDPRLWATAGSHLASALVSCNYDIFALSEATGIKGQIETMVSDRGGNYSWIWFNTGKVNDADTDLGGGEWHAVAYNPDLFTAGTKGKFWLHTGDNGQKPHKDRMNIGERWYDFDFEEEGVFRTVDYVYLTHKVSGRTILFMQCHAPLNDEINTWAGGIIKYRITGQGSSSGSGTTYYPINKDNCPCILVGDLNSSPTDENNGHMYDVLKTFWKNAYDEAKENGVLSQSEIENPGTWENWRGQKSMLQSEKHRIDHVFCSSEFTVTDYRTNRYRFKMQYAPSSSGYRNFYPSDHVPVIAELSL